MAWIPTKAGEYFKMRKDTKEGSYVCDWLFFIFYFSNRVYFSLKTPLFSTGNTAWNDDLRFVNRFCSRTSAKSNMPYTPAKVNISLRLHINFVVC